MKVVVIGGGMAGLTACTSLRNFDKQVEITLVEPKDYIEIHWASYRALFDSDIGDQCTFSINKWAVPKSVHHIRSTVAQVDDHEVVLADGQRLDYNVCVICTGATTRFPALGRGPPSGKGKGSGTRERRLHVMEQAGQRLLDSKSVLVVGGGLIGVEMAGDLAHHAKQAGKELKVTLVHSGEQLVPEFTPRAAKMAKQKLEHLGVEVILNETVRKQGDKTILQSSKEEVQAKEVVWTTGIYPCNNFLDKKYLDNKGWLVVDDYFRVTGAENKNKLFALGDCCDLLPNTGTQVLGTMNVIGKNIKVALDAIEKDNFDKIEKKMRKVLKASEVYVATIGKQSGVALTPLCHTQFFLPWIKNSTMFFFKPKGVLGLKD